MSCFFVEGGNPLEGEVRISSAKNAILPVLASTLLSGDTTRIRGCPRLRDVSMMLDIIEGFGAEISGSRELLEINTAGVRMNGVPERLMRRMRATIFLLGPLLARFSEARIAYPGGCCIGPRPVDWHLKALHQLGAEVYKRRGLIEARTDGLVGTEIHLDFPSVGVTENVMMAAVRARGQTVLTNAAREPEIVDLQNFLNSMGARISGAGTDRIRIQGGGELGPAEYVAIPDRIEAGTFMIAAAITGGEVLLENVVPEHLASLTSKLREMGVRVDIDGDSIRVAQRGRIRAADIKTQPYPGFPTDLQPQMVSLLSTAKGTGIVTENIFENRFKHTEELERMGARIRTLGRMAVVEGVERLSGAVLRASDLRAGAALVLAALAAEGGSTVENIKHIERGYEEFAGKLERLGAAIRCGN